MIARKIFQCLWAFSMLPLALSAQAIRGSVRDAETGDALIGTTLTVWQKDSARAESRVVADLEGHFLFEKLPPGTYRLQAQYTGYQAKTWAELSVAAGKDVVLEILMGQDPGLICDVPVITANRRAPQPMSEILLPREQVSRYPAMFFDPARLAAAFPGVAQTNDGINGMSIRGNGPAAVQWRLEGLEIVNPNHLPNAGTFSDLPTAASGGVLMFSAQMLDDVSLLTGALPAEYSNALGGTMDMSLRNGNASRHTFTAQAGLVGLDLAAEGPLSKRKKASYLANYRYSTVGLLGQLGVSFGDEQINFQDLAFELNFPGKRGGYFKVFGMGGMSENIFRHKSDTAEIKYNKDWQDIDFESITGLAGASARIKLGARTHLKLASIFSAQNNDWRMVSHRDTVTDALGYKFLLGSQVESSDSKWTASASMEHRFIPEISLRGGLQALLRSEYIGISQTLLQPWAELIWSAQQGRLVLKPALHGTVRVDGETHFVQPRLTVLWKAARQHTISAFLGEVAAPNLPHPYFHDRFARSQQVSLKYLFQPNIDWRFQAEFFAHQLYNVLVFGDSGKTWVLNEMGPFSPFFKYNFDGEGKNTGIELAAERLFDGGWFASANATWLQSKYRAAPTEAWQNTRWDIGHILNIAGGKEWARRKTARKTKTFGFSARAVWTGGFREMPIDFAASQAAFLGATVFDFSNGFSEKLPDYFRVDGRVYWKKSLAERRNTTFALECQNVTNRQNAGWHYYERQTNEVAVKYQLGLIPNLSWRIEF